MQIYEYIVNIQETVPKYDDLTNICKSFSQHILPIFQFIAELLLRIQLFCLNFGWSYIFVYDETLQNVSDFLTGSDGISILLIITNIQS